MKTSTRLNLYGSIAASVAAPAIMLYEYLPGASVSTSLFFVSRAIGAWLVIGALTFVFNWLFFGSLFLLGRWIWDSFYRTPTR